MDKEGVIADRRRHDRSAKRSVGPEPGQGQRCDAVNLTAQVMSTSRRRLSAEDADKDGLLDEYLTVNDSLIDILRVPAFYLCRDMLILNSNRAARELFKAGDLLRSSKGILSAVGQQETLALRAFVAEVFRKKDTVGKLWMSNIEAVKTGRYCELYAVFPRGSSDSATGLPATVLVFIADPEQSMAIPFSLLRSLFGLTHAECRIAVALLNGSSVEQFSDEAHISLNTARTHLKAVFQKTYTCSQPNLVSLLCRLVPPVVIVDADET